MKDLEAAQATTLAFYESNAVEYAAKTSKANLAELYEPFLTLLPKGARILDVGCGGGRDLKEFALRGFKPYGIDASPALAQLAQRESSVATSVWRVEEIEFERQFEGAWACASLVHLPKSLLAEALLRLRRSLVDGGILFVSMQTGKGEVVASDGRFFARYEETEICGAVQDAGFRILKTWSTADSLSDRPDVRWINLLARRS